MDGESLQHLQLKEILVGLEDEHKHLKISIDHLKKEIQKREVEIQTLLGERELKLAREEKTQSKPTRSLSLGKVDSVGHTTGYSSVFTSEVGKLLSNISRTAEEISSLIKL